MLIIIQFYSKNATDLQRLTSQMQYTSLPHNIKSMMWPQITS